MPEPEAQSGASLIDAFRRLGHLVSSQQTAAEQHNPEAQYGGGGDAELEDRALTLFSRAYEEMGIGDREELKNWKLELRMKQKGVVDAEGLFQLLRKLPDEDISRIRLFNRFVGQQLMSNTVEDFFEMEETRMGERINPFYTRFTGQASDFAATFGVELKAPIWPTERPQGDERDVFVRGMNRLLNGFRELPGIRLAHEFFRAEGKESFNAFFHIQRQFDSPTYKDFDEEKNPYPQPLPRIAAYRTALGELQDEFTDLEGSVGMCFDYCKMSKNKVVDFVLSAEDTFLRITTRLDRDYPLGVDYAHHLLHHRAHNVKMMMFPLRCLFFEELDARRGVKDSSDNTLDSYMDMTLGQTEVHIPSDYEQDFNPTELEEDLQKALHDMTGLEVLPSPWSSSRVVSSIQKLSKEDLDEQGSAFDTLSDTYEEKFKSDENNLSRRLARLTFLYLKAMAKRGVMADASRSRLDHIGNMAANYAEHAEKFQELEITPDSDLRGLKDDQLPLMASPEQMEDLFRTSKIVERLGENSEEFEEEAQKIAEGLKAAMEMMKQSAELMEKMVNRMFPNKEDSEDLLMAIRSLVELSYKTQHALADLAKKEGSSSKDPKMQKEIEKLKQEVEDCKKGTRDNQNELRDILSQKRELVAKMRITKAEKDYNNNQLRMITVMTINSMQAQKQV